MPHHGDESEHVNPEGEAASSAASPGADAPAGNASAGNGTEDKGAGRQPDGQVEADALEQAEEILNSMHLPAEESVASGAPSAEAAELKNDLLRLQAEYVNYRKRVERDRAVAGEMAVVGVLNSLLPVLDDIDLARQHGDLAEGPFAAIATKLENALKTYGLTRIDETNVGFDPNIHEALIQQPGTDIEVDTVSQVLRSGYRTGDRTLRAAQVIVAVPE